LRNELVRKKLLKRTENENHKQLIKKIDETKALSQVKEALLDYSPKTNFEVLMVDNTQRRYAIYLGYFLNKLSSYID